MSDGLDIVVEFEPATRARVSVRAVTRTPLHTHSNALEVVYVLRGDLHVRVSSEQFDLAAGDFAVLNRDDPHYLVGSADNVSAIAHLDLAAFRDVDRFCEAIVYACESFDLPRYRRQEVLLRGLLLDVVETAVTADRSRLDERSAELIRVLCTGYSLENYYNRTQQLTSAQRERLLRIVESVRTHLHRRDVLDAVAHDQHYSKSYVSHVVKDLSAESFGDLVNGLRVMTAEKLLLTTEATTLEVADACGFSHVKYFTRSFADWHKLTPAEFRARFRPEMSRDNDVTVVAELTALRLIREHRRSNHSRSQPPRLSITPVLLKNIGSRADLFDGARVPEREHRIEHATASATSSGSPHLVPIRIAMADLDTAFPLEGLASLEDINATPCLVLEFAGKSGTLDLMAAVAKRLCDAGLSEITIWLIYPGLHARAAVDEVITTAREEHGLTVQAILMA